jgi:hypothetical protein
MYSYLGRKRSFGVPQRALKNTVLLVFHRSMGVSPMTVLRPRLIVCQSHFSRIGLA